MTPTSRLVGIPQPLTQNASAALIAASSRINGRSRRVTRRTLWLIVAVLVVGLTAFTAPAWSGRSGTGGDASGGVLAGPLVRVIDGDTFIFATGGSDQTVRILGIDAPEVSHGSVPAGCGGDMASAGLKSIMSPGINVTLAFSAISDHVDRYGRLLGYATTSGVSDVGEWMIRNGFAEAWVPAGEPYPERWDAYTKAQTDAFKAQRGAWAYCDHLGR